MKASAIAHPIQGLIKYHGLRDAERVLPFHDSISVCMDALYTLTTVEVEPELKDDVVIVHGKEVSGLAKLRVQKVLEAIRRRIGSDERAFVSSINSLRFGKGLGFSSSAFASLGLAASEAYGLRLSIRDLTEIVRLGSGSATRSLVGGFAIWYANREGRSYAENLAPPDHMPLATVIIPLPSEVKTWTAHAEAVTSTLFPYRVRYLQGAIEEMKESIRQRDLERVCQLAEEDTVLLHAITMTGRTGLVLWNEVTLEVVAEVLNLRQRGTPVWFSIDTGPSVFLNTQRGSVGEVLDRIEALGIEEAIVSSVGGSARIVNQHLL